MALCLVALVSVYAGAWAQTPPPTPSTDEGKWDGVTAAKPALVDEYYQITNAEELYWISANIATTKDAKVRLMNDIDLNWRSWMPIGNYENCFYGVFDGNGKSIKHLFVDWGYYAKKVTNASPTATPTKPDFKNDVTSNIAFGFFGWLGGTVENLIIDQAQVLRTPRTANANANVDLRIGVLAGSVGEYDAAIRIENVVVKNAKILDDVPDGKRFRPAAYMVGGLIGDLHGNGYESTAVPKKSITINNIYCDVDVDLSCSTLNPERDFSNKGQQFYVGGIVGRARTLAMSHMPKNTVFSGKVNAPLAFVGPVFGAARNNNAAVGSYAGAKAGYAGDFTSGATTNDDFRTTHYFNYKLTNNTVDPPVDINVDETHPDNVNADATRTITAQTETCSTFTRAGINAQVMSMLQGVNRGSYADETVLKNKVYDYNTDHYDSWAYQWMYDATTQKLGWVLEKTPKTPYSVELEQAQWNVFAATPKKDGTETSEPLHYEWMFMNDDGKLLESRVTTEPAVTIAPPKGSTAVRVYLLDADSDNRKVVNYQVTKADVPITIVNPYVVDFAVDTLTVPFPEIILIPTVKRDGEEQEGFNFTVELSDGKGKVVNLSPDADGKLKLSPLATNVSVMVIATKEGVTGVFESVPRALGYYVDLSQDNGKIDYQNEYTECTYPLPIFTKDGDPKKKFKLADPLAESLGLKFGYVVTAAQNSNEDIFVNEGEREDFFVEGNGFHLKIYDVIFVTRWAKFRCEDKYGFSSFVENSKAKSLSWNNRVSINNLSADNPLSFGIKYIFGGSNNAIYYDNRTDDYTYEIKGPRDADFVSYPDISTSRSFSIAKEDFIFGNQWQVRITDGYGNKFTETLTLDAVFSIDMQTDGKYAPLFAATNTKYPNSGMRSVARCLTDKEDEDFDITYSWKVVYKNADGTVDHETTVDGKYLESLDLCDMIEITLTATDRKGTVRTATQTFAAGEDLIVDLDKTSETPVKYTAGLRNKQGMPVGSNDAGWQWYGISDLAEQDINNFTPLATGKELTEGTVYPAYCAVYTHGDKKLVGYVADKDVIYVYCEDSTRIYRDVFHPAKEGEDAAYSTIYGVYPTGDDENLGRTPNTAVRTMKRAYELLNASRGVDKNIIVIMGYVADDDYLTQTTRFLPKDEYKRCATITGLYGDIKDRGALRMLGAGGVTAGLNGATEFKDIIFNGRYYDLNANTKKYYHTVGALYLYCNLNDLTIGEGVYVQDYTTEGISNGLLGNAPDINFIGGMHNYDNQKLAYPSTNVKQGVTTITVRSGCFGRIIACSRNNGTYNYLSSNCFGHPDYPHHVEVSVDINHSGGPGEFTLGVPKGYTYDIGLLVGGQTDGTVYADSKLNMKAGKVGRFISGNISYGRKVGYGFPSDSFFGSTELTLEGGEIAELVGGTLGRWDCNSQPGTDKCDAYFYGRSILNIKGGTISNNVYGAGAGGVLGIGDDDTEDFHTDDTCIPYKDENGYLKYGDYDAAKGNMPVMTLADGTELDLGKSYCEVNISEVKSDIKTIINGSVYGGGFGYAVNIDPEKASGQAGYVFGDTKVTMTGGTVQNVYGGSSGSPSFYHNYIRNDKLAFAQPYYDERVAYWQTQTKPNSTKKYTLTEAQTEAKKDTAQYIKDFYFTATLEDGVTNRAEAVEAEAYRRFGHVARVIGKCEMILTGGVVEQNVYGGSQGFADFKEMATLYGNANVKIDGAEVNGNIYGGCDLASIRKSNIAERKPTTGMTEVRINSGTIGNCIFGGSKGVYDVDAAGVVTRESVTEIEGDTHVYVDGGDWINTPYINKKDKKGGYRSFNMYGGGDQKCRVRGTAYLNVTSSLMSATKPDIFIPRTENPNADENDIYSPFQSAYMDITYRRFAIFGGGYGENTNCLNTKVLVTIPKDRHGVHVPHGKTLTQFYDHQSFFDIAGGGYSGDIGYWAKRTGVTEDTPGAELYKDENGDEYYVVPVFLIDSPTAEEFEVYVGGHCNVEISGYTYCRKVIGGGFYGSCYNTETHVHCGSLRQAYGGSLLGYVHGRAKLNFGNRMEAWLDRCGGNQEAAADSAKFYNSNLFITENCYGGNDVKGIIGTTLWKSLDGHHNSKEDTDGGPLWMADVEDTEEKGVVFNIYGGTFMGDVYGAGNGHYRGYYVPEWVRYEDGPIRMYRKVITSKRNASKTGPEEDEDGKPKMANVYRSRPMVGCVNINIRGNSQSDSIVFHKNFYGGGRECTIGQWRTILPFEDPRRLTKGGHLHVNIGGNVHFMGNMYMGVEGQLYANQATLPANINLDTYDGSTTNELNKIGEAAYDHWYFNKARNRYEPGFPAPGEVDGNFGMTGEHLLRGYMKNIEMQGDVELTFYRDLYKTSTGENDSTQRRHWIVGEVASMYYDADNITMNSFFLGGKCGSMTNNNVMRYCYDHKLPLPSSSSSSSSIVPGHETCDVETFGAIYRVVMPKGVTIKNLLSMGSEDATLKIYPYKVGADGKPDFTDVVRKKEDGSDNATYVFEGGMVTQAAYSYDYLAYNDQMKRNNPAWVFRIALPEDFYSDQTNKYTNGNGTLLRDEESREMLDGTTIYRFNYDLENYYFTNITVDGDLKIDDRRYAMAVRYEADDTNHERPIAYIGQRETRSPDGNNKYTVSKLTSRCIFEPQYAEGESTEEYPDKFDLLYGGIIYGGCYNSGIVTGDVILNVASNMLGSKVAESIDNAIHHKDESFGVQRWFDEMSKLKFYVGRVYGGGYGEDSRIDGDTYVNLLRHVNALNVFGGGMKGDVTGTAHINYIGSEEDSYVYGAIYGGGLKGSIGKGNGKEIEVEETVVEDGVPVTKTVKKTVYQEQATDIELYSGNVDHVYGGSCMGDLYGSSNIKLCDEVIDALDHLEYKKLMEYNNGFEDWGGSRLIAGTVFGGNDIAGNIYYDAPAQVRKEKLDGEGNVVKDERGNTVYDGDEMRPIRNTDREYFSVYVKVMEVRDDSSSSPSNAPSASPEGPGKTSPGSDNGYNGFPLVGNIYAGSNGNYGNHKMSDDYYIAGSAVEIATGDSIYFDTVNLAGVYDATTDSYVGAYAVPNVPTAFLDIQGGTIVNAYGGGDRATLYKADASRSTNIGENYISVNYPEGDMVARAGFETQDEMNRVWNVCHLSSQEQLNEVLDPLVTDAFVFKNQILRVFGGNNNADMDIQPRWNLYRGYIGSVYSGGNFGRMTYFDYDFDAGWENVLEEGSEDEIRAHAHPKGLKLTINSPQLHAESVFGGARVGNISPAMPHPFDTEAYNEWIKDFYGATLVIDDGVIDHVYGGNDVSGEVEYGTHVIIRGAISGDVYCAGNGDYRYKYDWEAEPGSVVQERYDDDLGGRYFVLSPMENVVHATEPSGVEKIDAINEWRPNVQRTKLHIEGREGSIAYVHGNVYCGGNSSTVNSALNDNGQLGDIKFEIGSNVTLNGVFLGSNGESLVSPQMMGWTEDLNDFHLADDDLLDHYMKAVEVNGLPDEFHLDPKVTNAYIGDFYIGGNRGSMVTTRTIDLTFPENINIYGKIVGGSNNANVNCGLEKTYYGGLIGELKPYKDALGHDVTPTEKVHLSIYSKFVPKRLTYPVDGNIFNISLDDDFNDKSGQPVVLDADNDGNIDDDVKVDSLYYSYGRCNIYGGCYNSGTTVGNVRIDLYSDMINYGGATPGVDLNIHRRTIVNGINDKQMRTFSVIGGGFGVNSQVRGDICIRLMPEKKSVPVVAPETPKHPSCAALFAGSQEGLVVGNTTIEVRDGTVLANVYGGSEASPLYGSTQIIVGYPQYYVCQATDEYKLKRADDLSRGHDKKYVMNGNDVVKTSVWYREGDLVPNNVYDLIRDYDTANSTSQQGSFVRFPHPNPNDEEYGSHWDNISIHIGDPTSRDANTPAEFAATKSQFYGHGNIYGGGFIGASSNVALAGHSTVCRFKEGCIPADMKDMSVAEASKYGGNSSIMIWDNQANNNYDVKWTDSGYDGKTSNDINGVAVEAVLKDHITVGTGRYVPVTLTKGADKMGFYFHKDGKMMHQPSGFVTNESETFYKIEADGGVYGDGRKVFCDGFRACDVAFYGYADHAPQYPKLFNTFQRVDILNITDCCMKLQGANDFATNSTDATLYSMTRIGELHMQSSLIKDEMSAEKLADATFEGVTLESGNRDNANLGNILHEKPRSRNFMAFFNSIRYLGAFVTNEPFNGEFYHDENGAPHRVDPANADGYIGNKGHKGNIINTYYDLDAEAKKTDENITAFKKRNLGTAANMIGMNNGYNLKIQGAWTERDVNGEEVDCIYYGPAIGVAEVKLLTLAVGEGGGYIYALNHHKEDDDDKTPNFLQDIGNFVFPGAAFLETTDSDPDKKLNYIIDDCFPMGLGYDHYMANATGNVNNDEEIHYWYVNGQRYFYNITLTGITSDETNVPSIFHLDNSDNLITFYGIDNNTKEISLQSVEWTDVDGNKHIHDLTRVDDNGNLIVPETPEIGGYQLFISLDENTKNEYETSQNGSWVSGLPRKGYEQTHTTDEDGNKTYTYGSGDAYNPVDGEGKPVMPFGYKTITTTTTDSYGHTETKTVTNSPLLGVMLKDRVENNALDYYNSHLSMPSEVKFVVRAKNVVESTTGGEPSEYDYTYTVNLTIKYIKGASVKGHIVIENCALPGEFIYANAFDVVPEGDENNLYISSRKWYMTRLCQTEPAA